MSHLIFLLIGILTIQSISSQTMPVDGSQPQPCNSCCQGPSGTSGHNGHNGLPGRDGLKGEKGDIGGPGLEGERGLPGPQGLSGEKGDGGLQGVQGSRGHPGKVGPQGLKGRAGVGQSGPAGGKGEKGDLGTKGESGERNGRSAFTAFKRSSQSGNDGDVLTFQVTETNIGSNFDINTNRFTCQIPGVYWFTFTICRNHDSHNPFVDLVKDGTKITRAYFYENVSGSMLAQSTNGAVLQLAAGNQVWLQFGSNRLQVFSDSSKYTTFSGFLLYED
ncbi:uncharacterized protein [Amphiura filiformis]|uniref:uncharacterized protein n=1 Tax=Amphiura filiformis TaxID=82378 RepID=UPI003B213981